MIRLVYDHQVFWWQKYGGISRYFFELATRMSKWENFDVQIWAFAHINNYLRSAPKKLVQGCAIPQLPFHRARRLIGRLDDLAFGFRPFLRAPQILHETYYHSLRLAPRKTKIVVTIHDMIPEKFSSPHVDCFSDRGRSDSILERKRASLKRADYIICVSHSTKRDLCNLLNIPESKTSVIYHGISLSSVQPKDHRSLRGSPYILYVGERRGLHKNFSRFLQAFGSSENLKKNFQIVLFGGGPLTKDEKFQVRQFYIPEEAVRQFEGDDVFLAQLYREAQIFVYPSLYEGFGLPILEAMSLGCPVVCSWTSAMPEVAGDAAMFFDPTSVESIREALELLMFSDSHRAMLSQKGLERAEKFSWDLCAEKTRAVYLSLI